MRNITERKRLEKEILAVSSRERHSIGRDLHDGLGQELTGVALMLRGLAARLETRCPETLPQVEEVMGLVNQSVQTARSLARGLLPLDTVDGGLAGALHALAERSQDLYGLKVVCRLSVSPEPLPDVTSKHLYRIAQEALTNAARHAKATRVHIFFRVTGTQFLLRIGDDGIGMPKAGESSGMGLKIMRYRAGIIGATFEVQPHVPHGTLIVVAGQYQAVTDKLTSAFAI
jgi:signal transduction histidine kinase